MLQKKDAKKCVLFSKRLWRRKKAVSLEIDKKIKQVPQPMGKIMDDKMNKITKSSFPFILALVFILIVLIIRNFDFGFSRTDNNSSNEISSSLTTASNENLAIDSEVHDNETNSTVTELTKSETRDPSLKQSVYQLSSNFVINKTDVTIIGAEFGDDQAVGNGLDYDDIRDDVSETSLKGFSIGLKKGFSDEAKKRDASFAVYIKATPSDAKSPRDVEKFAPNIKVTDDKGDSGVLLYNSFSEPYLTINEQTYGVIIFAVYSDSKTFNVSFDDKKFTLTDLPYIEAKE